MLEFRLRNFRRDKKKMEIVWSMDNPILLSFEEEIALAKDYSEYISLGLDKILKFLERESVHSVDNVLKSNNLKPLIILHDSKIGEEYNEEDFQKIYDISKELNIPYFLVNPAEKPENLSSIVAIDVFNRNLKKLLNFVEIPIVLRIKSKSIVNTFGRGWKIAQGNEKIFLLLDTFDFYSSEEDLDVLKDKDLSKIKFVHLKDAENVPRYYLRETQQLFPGEGVIPLIQILTYLRDGGFDGYIVPEVRRPEYGKMDPKEYANRLFKSTKYLLSNL